jgi:hypothetical protein
VWCGARLRDVLHQCDIMGTTDDVANVCFEGAKDLSSGGSCEYGTSLWPCTSVVVTDATASSFVVVNLLTSR